MENRRDFLKKLSIGSGLFLAGQFPYKALANASDSPVKITILHTNDTHSRLEPFPASDRNFSGMGGVARRAALIKQIRQTEKNVLLFDAGDFFQGTPYFNLYKGEAEIKAMNMMQYDACTLGNHEFDLGLDNLSLQLKKANFPALCANYDFGKTAMKNRTAPYKTFNVEGIKIGVFGLGIQLQGLVPAEAYENTKYTDAIEIGKNMGVFLKEKKKCNMVICLSHLGFEYKNTTLPSDRNLAKETEHIDLIIGGHTHTFLDNVVTEKNRAGKNVAINQVGWGGIKMGRLDYFFSTKNAYSLSAASTINVQPIV